MGTQRYADNKRKLKVLQIKHNYIINHSCTRSRNRCVKQQKSTSPVGIDGLIVGFLVGFEGFIVILVGSPVGSQVGCPDGECEGKEVG